MHLFIVLVEWESTMQTMIDVETLLVSENKTNSYKKYSIYSWHQHTEIINELFYLLLSDTFHYLIKFTFGGDANLSLFLVYR